MTQQILFRIAFLFLLLLLFAMRFYFMIKVRSSGGRLMPDQKAVEREGWARRFDRSHGGFLSIDSIPGDVSPRHGLD